jgi:hypothetical protein
VIPFTNAAYYLGGPSNRYVSVYSGTINSNNGTFNAYVTFGGNIYPATDNSVSCGTSANRWTAIYAVNGTIQTSSATKKSNIVPLTNSTALNIVNDFKPSSYQWIDDPTNSTNFGLIAEDVQSTMNKFNIPAYEGLLYVPPTGSTDSMGINYSNIIPFLIGAVQQLSSQVTTLQAQVAELQAKI